MKVTHGSLFSGIGGFDLAAEWAGLQNLFHCEFNPFGQYILNYYWPESELLENVETADFKKYRGTIDVLSGGFPCQDASIAKQWGEGQLGLQGARTGLTFHMLRAIDECRPRYVIAENVANFLKVNNGDDFKTIIGELAGMGYNAEWRICRSSDVGAPHHRARLYIVAYPADLRLSPGQTFFSHVYQKASPQPWFANGTSVQTFRGGAWSCEPPALCVDDWFSKPMAGFSASQWRKEQIKAFGNAVSPQIPYAIFQAIQQFEDNHRPLWA